MKLKPKQIVLLRVGIDSGCGGLAGPLLQGGRFEFVPIPGDNITGKTYGNSTGIKTGKPLISFFPVSMRERRKDQLIHNDPEFRSWTYGDPTQPKQGLKKLTKGDLLVFYCGLRKNLNTRRADALYIVGYFVVEAAGTYRELADEYDEDWILSTFAKNHHVIHGDKPERTAIRKNGQKVKTSLVLIKGGVTSRLLAKPIRLSALVKEKDKGGHDLFVLSPTLKRVFGHFPEKNAIQRSIPRWVNESHIEKAAEFLERAE